VKPLSLAIDGLTSFKATQQVDLSDFDLFVITGPTGAGKSSILDAITFALYGSVARVNAHELRDLISHGSTHMRVRLDFLVDGRRYRVARRMGRSTHQATLERVENGSAVTDLDEGGVRAVNRRLEEIIGLDFTSFTKAVLLPQGAFHEFLRGDVGERRRILVRLLDLGRYEAAGQRARGEAARLEAVIEDRRARVASSYADATAPRLLELEEGARRAGARDAAVERAAAEARSIIAGAAEAERSRQALASHARDIDGALVTLRRLAAAGPELEAEARRAREDLEAGEARLDGARTAAEKARGALGKTMGRTGDAAALARLDAAATAAARERAEVERLDGELAAARDDAETQARAHRDARALEAAARATVARGVALRERAQDEREGAAAVDRRAEAAAALADLDRRLASARADAEAAGAALEDARGALRRAEHEHGAILLRAGLAPGDPCPVCAGVVEALPERDGDVETLLEAAERAGRSAERRERAAREAAVELQTRRRAAADELAAASEALSPADDPAAPADAVAALGRAEDALGAAVSHERAARAAMDDAAALASSAEARARAATATAEGVAENRRGARARLRGARSELVAAFGPRPPADAADEIARRRDELGAAEDARRRADEAAELARAARDAAQRAHGACAERLAAFDRELVAARTAARIATEAVAGSPAGDGPPPAPGEDAARGDLLTAWIACCEACASGAAREERRLGEEIGSAASRLDRVARDAGLPLASSEPSAAARALEDAARHAHGIAVAARKDVEALGVRIDERRTLEREIADDTRSLTLYRTLGRELRADRFVAFVLEESMTRLAVQASDELRRISGGRYSLVAKNGSFEVIDHHNADERRSVATLSGGETFLASLSLALALSTGLRDLAGTAAGRLEAIFIDEGFGALDPEALDVAVDALERLRESERMIGVITHLPTLADRIPAGLDVAKNGSSSRILVR
jgi:exonuclease SbcC